MLHRTRQEREHVFEVNRNLQSFIFNFQFITFI